MSILSFKQPVVPDTVTILRPNKPLPRPPEEGLDGDDLTSEEADHNWAVAVALASWPICLGASAVWAVL